MSLKNRVAIVTGAAGSLGTAVSGAFLKAGAQTVVLDSREAELQALAERLSPKGNCLALVTDVLDETSVRETLSQVSEKFGRIEILVNIVGGFLGGVTIAETTEEQWDNMFNVNLKSAFLCSKHVLPVMMNQKWGRIINIGARAGLQGTAGMAAYCAAKAAAINFTQTLAAEGRAFNITANAVLPSIIDTPPNREAMPDADFKKWVKPQAIAEVILFLCSDAAADISGAALPIYGKA